MKSRGEYEHEASVRDWLKAAERGELYQKAGPAYWAGTSGVSGPFYTDANRSRRALNRPELVEWFRGIIFICCRLNANAVARQQLRLYETTMPGQHRPKTLGWGHGRPLDRREIRTWQASDSFTAKTFNTWTKGADSIDEVTTHPLLDAISTNVNPDWDHGLLIRHASIMLDLLGLAYWWMEPGGGNPCRYVWPLLPQYMLPVRSGARSLIDYYNYGTEQFRPHQLVRMREVAARDPYANGVGPTEASTAYFQVVDGYVSFTDNILTQGARPSVIVSNKDATEPMGRMERERFQREIGYSFARAGQGGVWAVDGAIDVNPFQIPPTDTGGIELADNALQRIANSFGVPLSLIKTEDVNLANAQAGHRQHAELAIDPRCAMIASALTKWTRLLGRELDGSLEKAGARVRSGYERLVWAFDNPVKEDEKHWTTVVDMQLKNGMLTINEARLDAGRAPVSWGDEPWFGANLVQPSVGATQRDRANRRADELAGHGQGGRGGTNNDGHLPAPTFDPEDERGRPRRDEPSLVERSLALLDRLTGEVDRLPKRKPRRINPRVNRLPAPSTNGHAHVA